MFLLPGKISTETKVTPVGIQEDMDYLKKEVAKVDKLKWMREKKALDPLQTDIEWVEGTIKDITEKGDKVLNKPASTPTTTTTGFGHPVSGSSPSKVGLRCQDQENPPIQQGTGSRNSSQVVSNLASKISPQNRRPSSLLKLTPEGQIVPIDITSTEGPLQERYLEGPMPTLNMLTSTSAKAAGRESTAAALNHAKTNPQTCGSRDRHQREAQVRVPTGSHPATKHQVSEKSLQGGICGPQKAVHQYPSPPSEQLHLYQIKPTPGAYPYLPEDEEDTGDLFEELKIRQAIRRLQDLGMNRGNVWDALKEFLLVARFHIEVALRLYWSIAGPLFNSRSQYWVRNKSGNTTLLDGLAFILAVPGAFLGLLVFV